MKNICFLSLCFLIQLSILCGEPTKIYLCAKIGSEEKKTFNSAFVERLFPSDSKYDIFMPQEFKIKQLSQEQIEKCAYHVCREAIDWCDLLLVVSPYGKDCSWEVGYAKGQGKKVVAFIRDPQSVQDTMVITSVDLIFTQDQQIYSLLKEDPRTKENVVYLDDLKESLIFLEPFVKQVKHS